MEYKAIRNPLCAAFAMRLTRTHGNGLYLLERISSSTEIADSYWFSSKHVSTRLRWWMVRSRSAPCLAVSFCVVIRVAQFGGRLLSSIREENA
ncbi:hypothetical protein GY45DRAFT_871960 [Cubamyces sp. BRFM 1775]|nr:hypothetical protein GY45DRAFT_871960 [Cubamyces sp. BRFM 1775]